MKNPIAKTLLQTAAIVLLGGAAAAIHGSLRPVSISQTPPPAANPQPGEPQNTDETSPFETVTLQEAYALFEDNAAVFLDARNEEDYTAGHVPGSFWLPFSAFFSGKPPQLVNELPQDMPLVVYCEGGDCHASHQVAEMLLDFEFTDLRILEAGWPGWEEAGYPIEEGAPLNGQ